MLVKYRYILHTPQNTKKITEMKSIPYFLPVVHISIDCIGDIAMEHLEFFSQLISHSKKD